MGLKKDDFLETQKELLEVKLRSLDAGSDEWNKAFDSYAKVCSECDRKKLDIKSLMAIILGVAGVGTTIAGEVLQFETAKMAYASDEEIRIVRNKQFEMKPMYPEDACVQMELLGHGFYVFRNAESEEINVVYKRKDGAYGLIEPEN